jgi:hypothetical protein
MRIARRLYFYFVAGVSLAALTIGLVNLLELLLSTLGDALGDTASWRPTQTPSAAN